MISGKSAVLDRPVNPRDLPLLGIDLVNSLRYVSNNPVNEIDPSGLETKEYWVNKAKAAIGYNPGSPTHPKDILEGNCRITAAYAKLYLQDPSRFLWAGMAALASSAVGEGR